MKALKTLLFLLVSFSCSTAWSQDSTYTFLLRKYNDNLERLNGNLLKNDTSMAYAILSNNEDIYARLLQQDTTVAKSFIAAQNVFLDSFNYNLESARLQNVTKKKFIQDLYANTEWYKVQYANASQSGLENCPGCFLSRKVKVTVMMREQNKLDTLKCINVEFKKLAANKMQLATGTIVSAPCPEFERQLSTGPGYQFSLSYKGRQYAFKREITMGSALTDVLPISLVLEP